ncbi:lysylphosphatidylglycerol synthase transmembrane domain-containing protein [Fulvimonas yonginensis]|uniref:Lysylphosphatidylglycerol synthase transmembrane domain-containing protein n=1 Tax=Fulvimonas yonginensis TaxID=1495200 RepID=A0ABU8JD35_9GAMM
MQSSPRRTQAWQGASWLLGLISLAALAGVVARRGDIERFARLLHALAPGWLVLGLVLQAGTYACVALAWDLGLRQNGIHRPVRELLALALGKLFVDQSVPVGGVGGTAFVVATLHRHGVPHGACLGTLVLNLLGQYLAYLVAAGGVTGSLWLAHQAHAWMLGITGAFVLVCVAAPLVMVLVLRLGRRLPRSLLRLPGMAPLARTLADVPAGMLRKRRLPAIAALNLALIALDAATLWAMLHALGLPAPFRHALPGYLLALMVTTVAPIPMGLGAFEATGVAALTSQGVPIEGALAATLLLRGYTTWLPMLPGWLVAHRALRRMR